MKINILDNLQFFVGFSLKLHDAKREQLMEKFSFFYLYFQLHSDTDRKNYLQKKVYQHAKRTGWEMELFTE